MSNFTAIADLISTLNQYVPDSEKEAVAKKANMCLLESIDLAVEFNQMAALFDRDNGDITTALNYLNLTLSEISKVSKALTDKGVI